MKFKGKFSLLTILLCFLTFHFAKATERNFKPYQWEDSYYPKVSLYAMKNTMYTKEKKFTDLATLLDKTNETLDRLNTNDSSSTERNSRNRPKAILEAIRRLLEADLNSISFTNLKNKKLPYGVIFDFKDKNPEEGQSECYSLLASGYDRKWTLIDEKGNTTEGEVKIDKSEIWFRHKADPSTTDIIEPKTKSVIQNIRGFKNQTRLQGGSSTNNDVRHYFGDDNLDKAKRAAHFDPKRDNAFIGYYNIENKKTDYDIETTLYTVSWSATSSKDVRKDRLKFESDLIYDDFEEGDQVIDSKDTSNPVDIGYIDSIKIVEGQTTIYTIKYKNEAQTWQTEVEEDSLALWSKSKYANTDASKKFEILYLKIQMLEQNNFKRPGSNAMLRALQKVAEKETEIFDISNGNAGEKKFTEPGNENGIVSEIESEEDVPTFFAGLESKVKKPVLQFIVSAIKHHKNFGPEFIQEVETKFGLPEPQIEGLIQWMNRDAFKALEIVEDELSLEISKCSACSSTIKCFHNSQQLIEFDAQYSDGWSCDMCGKNSREKDLFPMNHCTDCKQDQCKLCIPSLECFPWYDSYRRKNESKNVKNQDLDIGNHNAEKTSFDKTSNRATEVSKNDNDFKKRKRDNSTEQEGEICMEISSEEEEQNRKL